MNQYPHPQYQSYPIQDQFRNEDERFFFLGPFAGGLLGGFLGGALAPNYGGFYGPPGPYYRPPFYGPGFYGRPPFGGFW